jgi:hypothetical protein
MEKCVSKKWGKKHFLLGKDKEGIRYWLVQPTWDCSWYWGAGYVSTIQNNRIPESANDIDSHQHFDNMFLKVNENGKIYLDAWKEFFVESPLTEKEIWQLMEYMKSIYTLKEAAELFVRGGSNISKPYECLKSPESAMALNEKILPALFEKVEELLSKND